jgi:hypothetical protein
MPARLVAVLVRPRLLARAAKQVTFSDPTTSAIRPVSPGHSQTLPLTPATPVLLAAAPASLAQAAPCAVSDSSSSHRLHSASRPAPVGSTLMLLPLAAWPAPSTALPALQPRPASPATQPTTIESMTGTPPGAFLPAATSKILFKSVRPAPPGAPSARP